MDPVTNAKLIIAFESSLILGFFMLVFWYGYRRFFWKSAEARTLFWIFNAIFLPLIIAKFFVGFFYKGYIPELMFFYAIPSPKAVGIGWLLIAVGVVAAFLYFRRKIETFPTRLFLLLIIVVFFVFAVSVAGIREGMKSVADPFTRTYWEYTGFLPQIENASTFLRDYVAIISDPSLSVAKHATTHPPGYTLTLYFLARLFSVGHLGLALFVIALGGFSLVPLFFFFRGVLSESESRRALEVFAFAPGFVMASATSMESVLLLLTSLALAFCFAGWKKNLSLALLGGVAAALALFSNFLFLLLVPFFAFLLWQAVSEKTKTRERVSVLLRALSSAAVVALFFLWLQKGLGYSLVENFFVSRVLNTEAVGAYYALSPFFIFLFINIADFLFYAGLPLVILFFRGLPETFALSTPVFKAGVALAVLLLTLNLFQGNIGRLWLFILPIFMLFANKLFSEEHQPLFKPFIALTAFQIVVTQIAFYTFF